MMGWIFPSWVLVLAWIVPEQPVAPIQIEFTSKEACQKAEGAISLEYSRKQARGELFLACVQK